MTAVTAGEAFQNAIYALITIATVVAGLAIMIGVAVLLTIVADRISDKRRKP